MSLKINGDPVSTPASEWAEQTTSALGSSANKVSTNAFSTGASSTATTPGVDVPGAFPGPSGPNEPMTLPDVSQHVENAKEYINSVDLSQHVETVRQYIPAREDVQATVANVAQTMGQYLPDGVVNAAQELVGRGGHSTTPHDIDSDLRETSADREGVNGTEEPVRADATIFDQTSTQPSPKVDSNDEPFGHATHSTVADTQHAARVPLPPPTSSFAQPTVDVSKDEESGSPVVTVHPEAEAEASSPSTRMDTEGFGAVGTHGPQSQSDFKGLNDTVRDTNTGLPDTLPAISSAQGNGTGTTASSAPTGLEKPISVPMSGALSPAPAPAPTPPPKETATTTTATAPVVPSTVTGQDAETRSTSSDAAIPSMGSEDKLGGHQNWDGERSEEGGADTNGPEKEKKGSGASKLLGKVKEKLKSGHGQKV